MLPRTTTADGEEERVKNNSAGDGVDGGNQRENTIWNITADDILRGNLIITTREHIPPPPVTGNSNRFRNYSRHQDRIDGPRTKIIIIPPVIICLVLIVAVNLTRLFEKYIFLIYPYR